MGELGNRKPHGYFMAFFLPCRARVVRGDGRNIWELGVGSGAHLSAVLNTFQDAAKVRAELRLMLPALGHDSVPRERQEFMPPETLGCPPPWAVLLAHTGPGQFLGGSILFPVAMKSRTSWLVCPG